MNLCVQAHACNSHIRKARVEGSGTQGQSKQQNKFKTSLGSNRSFIEKTKQTKEYVNLSEEDLKTRSCL